MHIYTSVCPLVSEMSALLLKLDVSTVLLICWSLCGFARVILFGLTRSPVTFSPS